VKVFFDTSAFLKILKKEDGYGKVVEWIKKLRNGEHEGYTDAIVIAEIVYAFLSLGLDDKATKLRAYVESIPNLTVIEEFPVAVSHRSAELKRKYFKRSEKTFFSLYDGLHLALAERHCELFMTSDSDFKNVTEVKIEFV
jgi:predicted nucleic acid-binding protein